jgi:hypothetical protein
METASQLPLLNIPEPGKAFDINRLDGTRKSVGTAPSRGSAESALASRVVDDRVFQMGMTNWKAVIDRAIFMGHTELFDSEFGRLGLRKHGFRYSPVPLLPERGAEYVKSCALIIGASKLSKKMRDQFGCTAELANGKQLKIALSSTSIDLVISDGDRATAVQVLFDDVVFSDGRDSEDINFLGKRLSTALKRQASIQGLILKLVSTDVSHVGQCTLAVLAKVQEKSAWNA